MFNFLSYTLLTVLTVDLLATSTDITMTWTSPVIPKLKSNNSNDNPFDKPITNEEESWIGSLINIGAMIGPFLYGMIGEKFGRKKGLCCVAISHITSYLTLAFSKTVYLYYFARLLGGFAVGGAYTLLPIYAVEVAEDSNRGMLSSIVGIFSTFGNLLSYAIGPYTPIIWFNVILACVPTSFLVLFLIIAPETPHYLVGKNRINEAKESLMKLRSQNKKAVETELVHIQSGLDKDKKQEKFLDLFKSKIYMKALGISFMLVVGSQLSGINAVLFNTQEIFEAAGVNGLEPEVSSIVIGLVIFLSSFLTPFVADRMGRKLVLLISCFGVTIALVIFGVYFYLKFTDVDVSGISWLPIVILVFYIFMFNVGMGPLPWTVSAELFPTSVKSYTSSLVTISSYTASFLVTKFFNDLNDSLGKGGTFWLFAGFSVISGVFILLYVPETNGKSFKEIQEILKK